MGRTVLSSSTASFSSASCSSSSGSAKSRLRTSPSAAEDMERGPAKRARIDGVAQLQPAQALGQNDHKEVPAGFSAIKTSPASSFPSVPSHSVYACQPSRSTTLMDNVHGQILLPDICVAIINTSEFNRLRQIQQLGICNRVFGSATHTRFSHSVGVCHLAGKFARELNNNLENPNWPQATARDIKCVQVAGLCHDLGHAPFSHVFEKVLKKIGVKLGDDEGEWSHEKMGVRMLEHLFKKNAVSFEDYDMVYEEDFEFIRECIVGVDHQIRNMRDCKNSWPRPRWLYDIVSNHESGLDVDKLDYLMRDSKQSNVEVGSRFEYLLKCARVRMCEDQHLRIAFPDKAYMNVLKVFQCRYEMHQIVYQNRTVVGLEDLLVDAMVAAAPFVTWSDANCNSLHMSEAINDPYAFTWMTDTIWGQIMTGSDPNLSVAKQLLIRIDQRRKYPYIGEIVLKNNARLQARIYGPENVVLSRNSRGDWSDSESEPDCDSHSMQEYDSGARLTTSTVAEEIVREDTTGTLTTEDVIVHFKNVHHGKGIKNPNDSVYFFEKQRAWVGPTSAKPAPDNLARIIDSSKYNLPESFCERVIRVYCKRHEVQDILQECLRAWSKHNACPSPRGCSQSQETW